MVQQDDQFRRYQEALGGLSRSASAWRGDRQAAFREITEVAARTLGLARVGIWLFDQERTRIECHDQYLAGTGTHESGALVTRRGHPAYFAAAETARTLDAGDAVGDPRLVELVEDYLVPLEIGALLDAAILVGGEMVGVVCHEHVGAARPWTEEEQLFAGSISDFAALAVEGAQRAAAEGSLRRREEELRLALESARMGTWTYDLATQEVHWSDEVAALLGQPAGWTQGSYTVFLGLVHPDDRELVQGRVAEAIRGDGDYYMRHRLVHPDAAVQWIELRGRVERDEDGRALRLRGTIADVTEEQRLQEQLVQAQKMEGIGRLAGGIAHDFNNLITAITSCSELLAEQMEDRPAALPLLAVIDRSADRAADLTRRLLAFARRHPIEPRVVDLNEVLRELQKLLVRLLREDVVVRLDAGDDVLPVRIDPTQLEQVVVNLAVNAGDAMPEGGRLVVSSRVGHVTTADARRHAGASLGAHVVLALRDTGVGMDEQTLAHLFEPFFTTKPPGSGTGLGLATCYGIARQADGHIRVTSQLGQGATFEVWLPRHDGPVETTDPGRRERRRASSGSETLLLVEDDARVRELATTTLRGRGYRVLEARTGEEALRLARRHPEPIDLLVSDVVMPDGGGRWLAERLRELDPGLRVLLVSGYAEEAPTAEARFLEKPFTPSKLLETVRSALDES